MSERGPDTPALQLLRGSGLDTSGGPQFIQRRIALFAMIVTAIGLAFFVVGIGVAGLTGLPFPWVFPQPTSIAPLAGLVFIGSAWLIPRRGHYSLTVLEIFDGATVIGTCTAWALFVTPRLPNSLYTGIISYPLTLLPPPI